MNGVDLKCIKPGTRYDVDRNITICEVCKQPVVDDRYYGDSHNLGDCLSYMAGRIAELEAFADGIRQLPRSQNP